jgi:hypothetical protein
MSVLLYYARMNQLLSFRRFLFLPEVRDDILPNISTRRQSQSVF